MPSKSEREERKALLRAARETQRNTGDISLPLVPTQMQALFDFVEEQLRDGECDHSLRHTLAFLDLQQISPKDRVLGWLRNSGGYCDCEVIANAEGEFQLSISTGG